MLHINAVAKHMDKFLEVENMGVEDGALTTNLGEVYMENGRMTMH